MGLNIVHLLMPPAKPRAERKEDGNVVTYMVVSLQRYSASRRVNQRWPSRHARPAKTLIRLLICERRGSAGFAVYIARLQQLIRDLENTAQALTSLLSFKYQGSRQSGCASAPDLKSNLS